MENQFSVTTSSLNLPLKAALKLIAQLPVSGIRCDARTELKPREISQTGKRDLLKALNEYGLKMTALNFTIRRSFFEEADLDARIAATREAMELTAQLKARHLCLKIGEIPDPEHRSYSVLQQSIDDLARYGNHIGVVLTIIPIGKSPQVLKEFLATIRSGPTAIDFDPSRYMLGGHDPIDALRELYQSIEQFTARDAVRDYSGGGEETQLGRGEIVWDVMLATLFEVGYRGSLNIQRTAGENRFEDIKNAIGYLGNVAGELW
ncbi:MAG TPA: hypothetical protein DD473_14675 [Planctomycetaceae bacterium]|nr:hypothetical protein [Planctomycetaceae bacterium]